MLDIEMQAKSPHTTWCPVIAYNVNNPVEVKELEKVLAKFAALGYVEETEFPRIPPMPNGYCEVYLFKPGTGLFGSWTNEEQVANKRQLKAEFPTASWRRLTDWDLL